MRYLSSKTTWETLCGVSGEAALYRRPQARQLPSREQNQLLVCAAKLLQVDNLLLTACCVKLGKSEAYLMQVTVCRLRNSITATANRERSTLDSYQGFCFSCLHRSILLTTLHCMDAEGFATYCRRRGGCCESTKVHNKALRQEDVRRA